MACCSPQMQACAGHHVCDGECMKLAGGFWLGGVSGREEGIFASFSCCVSCLAQVQFARCRSVFSLFLVLPALAEGLSVVTSSNLGV